MAGVRGGPEPAAALSGTVGFVLHVPGEALDVGERQSLLRYGRALSDLVSGFRVPETVAQRAFVEFAVGGVRPPETAFELLWARYMEVRRTPLSLDLVPGGSWWVNCRSLLPPEVWKRLARVAYRAAGWRCQVCGGCGPRHPVEAHECWEYDERGRIQRLLGLEALCPACHAVRHLGLAVSRGHGAPVLRHLARVNGWTLQDVEAYVEVQMEVWARRTEWVWMIDLGWLLTCGVRPDEIRREPDGAEGSSSGSSGLRCLVRVGDEEPR